MSTASAATAGDAPATDASAAASASGIRTVTSSSSAQLSSVADLASGNVVSSSSSSTSSTGGSGAAAAVSASSASSSATATAAAASRPPIARSGSIALTGATALTSCSHINVARPWISWKKGNISEYVSKPRVFFDHLHQQIVLFTGSPPNKIWFSDRATQTWMDYPLHLPPHNDIIGAQFSPDRTHVALRVSDREVKVVSTATGEVVTARSCRGTSSRMISVHWLLDPALSKTTAASPVALFLLFVTNAGVELYELVQDKPLLSSAASHLASSLASGATVTKNKLRHVKTATYTIVYHWILLEQNVLLLVDNKNVFQAYKISSKQISKICKICVVWLYGRMVILFINEAKGQLHLLSLSSPTQSDDMEQTHVFDLHQPGKYDVSCIDNVLIVHNTATRVSMLFDVRSESKTTITEPLSIGPPLSAPMGPTGSSAAAGFGSGGGADQSSSSSAAASIHFFDPADMHGGSQSSGSGGGGGGAEARPSPGMSSLAPASFHPYVKWTFLSPAYVWESTGDQQQGNLWTLHINLQQIAFSWPHSKRARLVDFLLKRNSVQAKQLILQILLQIVCTEPASLALLSRLFSLINRMNYDHRMNPHAAPHQPINLATLPLLPPFSAPSSAANTTPNSTVASPAAPNNIVRPASQSVSPYASLPRAGGQLGSPLAAGVLPSFGSRLSSPAAAAGHRSTFSGGTHSLTSTPGSTIDSAASSMAPGSALSTPGSSTASSTPFSGTPSSSFSAAGAPLSYELDDSLSVLSCEMLDIPALQSLPLSVEHNLHGYMLISQMDIYLHVFERARPYIPLAQLIPVVVEFLRSTQRHFLRTEDILNDLLVSLLLQAGKFFEFHQFLQYHILSDSLPIANRLIHVSPLYPPAYQLGIDMLYRLNQTPRMIKVMLQHSQVIQALALVPSFRAPFLENTPGLYPRDFLTVAINTGDQIAFYHAYRFFENRNVALRGSAGFLVTDACEEFVQLFQSMFGHGGAQSITGLGASTAAAAAARGSVASSAADPARRGTISQPFVPPRYFNIGDDDDEDGEDGDIEYEGQKPDPYAPPKPVDDDDGPSPAQEKARSRAASHAASSGGAEGATGASSSSSADAAGNDDANISTDEVLHIPSPLDLSTTIGNVGYDAGQSEDAAAESGLGGAHAVGKKGKGRQSPEPDPSPTSPSLANADGSFGGSSGSSDAVTAKQVGTKRGSLLQSVPVFRSLEPAM